MRYFLTILLVITVYTASALERNNLQIADSLVQLSAKEICDKLKSLKIDTIAMPQINHPSSWLYEQHFPNVCRSKSITLKSNSSKSHIDIYINDLAAEYSQLEPIRDSVIRFVRYSFTANIQHKGEILPFSKKTYLYSDTISRFDHKAAEDYPYELAKSDLPEYSPGFFTKYLEPVLITSAAVLAVVLLFSLRSK